MTIQLDDDAIDPGDSVSITVIASYPTAIEWIEWEAVEEDNGNDNESSASDPELSGDEFDCDGSTNCANVWTVNPTVPGEYQVRARARAENGVTSEWVTTSLDVRDTGPRPRRHQPGRQRRSATCARAAMPQRHGGPRVTMEQTRCPNCGGYKVSLWPVQEAQNQEERDEGRLPTWFCYIALLFAILFVIGVVGALINNPIAILISVGVVGLVLLSFIWWANKVKIPRPVIITSSFNGCLTCGFRWDWSPGTPTPEAKVDTARRGARYAGRCFSLHVQRLA